MKEDAFIDDVGDKITIHRRAFAVMAFPSSLSPPISFPLSTDSLGTVLQLKKSVFLLVRKWSSLSSLATKELFENLHLDPYLNVIFLFYPNSKLRRRNAIKEVDSNCPGQVCNNRVTRAVVTPYKNRANLCHQSANRSRMINQPKLVKNIQSLFKEQIYLSP